MLAIRSQRGQPPPWAQRRSEIRLLAVAVDGHECCGGRAGAMRRRLCALAAAVQIRIAICWPCVVLKTRR